MELTENGERIVNHSAIDRSFLVTTRVNHEFV